MYSKEVLYNARASKTEEFLLLYAQVYGYFAARFELKGGIFRRTCYFRMPEAKGGSFCPPCLPSGRHPAAWSYNTAFSKQKKKHILSPAARCRIRPKTAFEKMRTSSPI